MDIDANDERRRPYAVRHSGGDTHCYSKAQFATKFYIAEEDTGDESDWNTVSTNDHTGDESDLGTGNAYDDIDIEASEVPVFESSTTRTWRRAAKPITVWVC